MKDKISMHKPMKQSNVNIKKVSNGFIVSGYKGDWEKEKTFIAKSEKDAKKIASKLL